MRRTLTTLIAATAVSLLCAPAAQAFTPEELSFLDNLRGAGIVNSDGSSEALKSGWAICGFLSQEHSRSELAREIFIGSQESNGAAGIEYAQAQALVFYSEANLCPGVQ